MSINEKKNLFKKKRRLVKTSSKTPPAEPSQTLSTEPIQITEPEPIQEKRKEREELSSEPPTKRLHTKTTPDPPIQ